uniref:Predicted protein n=1 Tax=Hordeum vulgare subsp. vulgare TaxID=112509 RepID=F2CQW4_HORVV|nr:predicted protein [Hordeum vulgare subsp. vulgare]
MKTSVKLIHASRLFVDEAVKEDHYHSKRHKKSWCKWIWKIKLFAC